MSLNIRQWRPKRKDPERRVSVRSHLVELRRRAVLSIAGIIVGTVVGWIVYPFTFHHIQAPITALHGTANRIVALNFGGVATSFDMQIKLSIFTGVILACPWWIYQIWGFIHPGLTKRERRHTVAYLGVAIPLFCGGVTLCWYVLPQTVGLLTSFTPEGAANLIDAQLYLSFVMRMMLAFGIAFLVPVVMVALTALSLVTGKAWLSGWRWAIVVNALFGAIATPTGDAVSMLILALPMTMLYMGAAGICMIIDRRRAKAIERELEQLEDTDR